MIDEGPTAKAGDGRNRLSSPPCPRPTTPLYSPTRCGRTGTVKRDERVRIGTEIGMVNCLGPVLNFVTTSAALDIQKMRRLMANIGKSVGFTHFFCLQGLWRARHTAGVREGSLAGTPSRRTDRARARMRVPTRVAMVTRTGATRGRAHAPRTMPHNLVAVTCALTVMSHDQLHSDDARSDWGGCL